MLEIAADGRRGNAGGGHRDGRKPGRRRTSGGGPSRTPGGPGGGSNRAGHGRPQEGTPQIRRKGRDLTFGPIPVSAVVSLEILAVGVLIAVFVREPWARALGGGLLILVGLLTFPVGRGGTLWAHLVRLLSFRSRTRSFSAVENPVDEEGQAVRDRPEPDVGDEPGWGETAVPADLDVLFDHDLAVFSVSDRMGREFGAFRHAGRWGVAIRVCSFEGVLVEAGVREIPLHLMCERLAALDVLGVGVRVVQYTSGQGRSVLPPALAALADELRARDGWGLRSAREAFVFLSVDPQQAKEAVAVRGGGAPGVSRLLTVLTDVARTALAASSVQVDVLERGDLLKTVEQLAMNPVRMVEGATTWTESRWQVISDMTHHRVLAATAWQAGADISPVLAVPAHAVVTALDLQLGRPGEGADVVQLVRVTAQSLAELEESTAAVVSVAQEAGMSLRPVAGHQRMALLATMGPGACG
ncbi:Putative type VII ESX secretion system translocon, EccE [Austwickia chelonae]|nr:type VII secretion protein EccE [Austwickia chelonae]SEW43477.1 Putative type VII ESX secretion system translocon, EccE [Austwickia chelonae]